MLRRILCVLVVLVGFLPLKAQYVDEMVRHLRFEAPARTQASVALLWSDSMRFEMLVPPLSEVDPQLGAETSYKLTQGDSVLSQGKRVLFYGTSPAAVSMVLRVWHQRATIEFGADNAVESLVVPYNCADTLTAYENPNGLNVIQNTMFLTTKPNPQYAHFDNTEQLLEYINNSEDVMECVWTYLDRDNDPDMAVPGGFYRLATLAMPGGGYYIVYLNGANSHQEDWQPLRIKGYLHPTNYVNHYNLEWLDSAGRLAASENFANIDPNSNILTLVFPLLQSQLRFSKL